MKIQLIALSLLIASCSAQKRIEKAKQIVLTNKPAFDSVGHIWAQLNPCVTDTIIDVKVDTIRGKDVIKTIFIKGGYKYLDTTINNVRIKLLEDGNVYIDIPEKLPTTVYKTAYITDKRQEDILKSDIQKLSIENANTKTTVAQKETLLAQKDLQIKAENKRGNNYVFWLIVTGIALAVSLFTIIYKTIKKP